MEINFDLIEDKQKILEYWKYLANNIKDILGSSLKSFVLFVKLIAKSSINVHILISSQPCQLGL